MDLHDKYRPDPQCWVCTCPRFMVSCFLTCKHLVQSVHPVGPKFFFEVERNRTTSFYSHASLIELPLDGDTSDDESNNGGQRSPPLGSTVPMTFHTLSPFEDPDPDQRLTTAEALAQLQGEASVFVNEMMPSQFPYSDPWWFSTLERECSGFFRLFRNLVNLENQFNSTRSDAPRTWDPKISNGMYYRPWPPASERHT